MSAKRKTKNKRKNQRNRNKIGIQKAKDNKAESLNSKISKDVNPEAEAKADVEAVKQLGNKDKLEINNIESKDVIKNSSEFVSKEEVETSSLSFEHKELYEEYSDERIERSITHDDKDEVLLVSDVGEENLVRTEGTDDSILEDLAFSKESKPSSSVKKDSEDMNSKLEAEYTKEEEKLEDNDSIIEKGYLNSTIKQGNGEEEGLIYYEVNNIYSNTRKRIYKNKYKLRKEPPVLTVKDGEDNIVEFELTENLTNELIGTLNEVKRAYYGFSGPTDINAPDKFIDKVKYYISKNPFKLILLAGIFIYFVIINFI